MGGKTSTEVKARWNAKTYRRYVIHFRYDTDHRLIDYLEKNKGRLGTSNIFRDALKEYIGKEGAK